jgi:spermidine/putrescine ABC transporter ATP-binding subunit
VEDASQATALGDERPQADDPDAATRAAASGSPDVRLRGLTKRYGDVVAVDSVDLEIAAGEFFTLLGPSGSGKTTTLRMIAGFEVPDAGTVELAGQDVTRVPPYDRQVNTVFQDYALFPHMSVTRNVEYGMRVQSVARDERARRASEALEMVRLPGYGTRKPSELSGGQRQRVALARAIVNRPRVLLLDEPLGALDLKLREQMQVELKGIQSEVGITFIYVTHDQDEALTMSDRVAVMHGGSIVQCAEPRELYEQPATAFVANFLGASNLIPVEANGDGLKLGSFSLDAASPPDGVTDALAMIRPENVRLEPHGAEGANRVPGMVEEVVYLGFHQEVRVRLATGVVVKADVPNDDEHREHEQGDPVAVHLPARHLRVLAVEE